MARRVLAARAFIPSVILFAELRWRPWWLDMRKAALKREASARCGCGNKWLTRLCAGVIDGMKGPQLPTVLSRHAAKEGLPTFHAYAGQQATSPEVFRSYGGALETALQGAWQQTCEKKSPGGQKTNRTDQSSYFPSFHVGPRSLCGPVVAGCGSGTGTGTNADGHDAAWGHRRGTTFQLSNVRMHLMWESRRRT